jgi:hypothetical protein
MKHNRLAAVLVGVLFVGAGSTVWLSANYYFSLKELERINGRHLVINNTLGMVQSLAGEAVEYSKRNPTIDPLLQPYDLKPKPPAATGISAQPDPTPAKR